ncbi:MAG: hypothetical protein ACKO23_08775 [Gemmataceae bacterium]
MFDFHNSSVMYAWLVVGSATIGLGIINLLLPRSQRGMHPWARPLCLAGLTLLLSGVSYFLFPGMAIASAFLILTGLLTGLGLLRTIQARILGMQLVHYAGRPRSQAAFLIFIGAMAVAWQIHLVNNLFEDDAMEMERLISRISMPPSLVAMNDVALKTEYGQPILLCRPEDGTEDESDEEVLCYLREFDYDMRLIEVDGQDVGYNCHGWIFAGGKGWLLGREVEVILRENGYQTVSHPAPGDLAVFRDDRGEIKHTALVRVVPETGPILMESKWGKIGRYVHTAEHHPYQAFTCKYYRSPRESHLLRVDPGTS